MKSKTIWCDQPNWSLNEVGILSDAELAQVSGGNTIQILRYQKLQETLDQEVR
jgi:bacteriocin-like protein